MLSFLTLLVLLFVSLVSATSATGNRLLAVVDNIEDKAKYSQFLGDLESRGFDIKFETPKSESLKLFHLGERTFDHIVFFPVKAKGLGPNLTPNLLLQFINAEGNILLALTSGQATPSSLVSLLSELDIQLPADRTGLVVDHFHYDTASAADQHDVLLLPPPGPLRPGIPDVFAASARPGNVVAFPRGVGAVLGPSPLLHPVLRAPPTAYSYNPREQPDVIDPADLFAAGRQLALVTAAQARNSARLLLVGAAEMLEDRWFDATVQPVDGAGQVRTFNREFAQCLAGWTFHEVGVLRVNWVEHHLNEPGGSNASSPKMYRVKNDVAYAISVSEWSWDRWTAFSVPTHDALQLEFSMLSPFHRLALTSDPARSGPTAAVFTAAFRLPDQHGIFNFLVDYRRPLLTTLEDKCTVSVRHMAHDEWPRSFAISGAWPWLAGIAATVVGWLGFVAVWMYSAPVGGKAESKKRQ